ncbi:hypothetical protein TrST_g9353 [Triparma strigata]|uniref:Uncharacterized protein n=1 Tax=Triparma strigata TaxID=1606541 RepID=A0A9W7EXX3_9STRA|nr:hypothetical protein TrST_g9353 [Triparma strigata]
MSRSFPDYMSLHSSLILLPADDEECIGAVCSSCEDEPDSSHPDPVNEGDILMTINGNVCKDLPFDKILAMARDSQYPVTLTFGQPDNNAYFNNGLNNGENTGNNDLGRRASEIGDAFGKTFSQWGRRLSTATNQIGKNNSNSNSTSSLATLSSAGKLSPTPRSFASTPTKSTSPPPPPSEKLSIFFQEKSTSPLTLCTLQTPVHTSSTLVVRPKTNSSEPEISYTYQWYRSDLPLPNCTTSSYRLNTSDVGLDIKCIATSTHNVEHIVLPTKPTFLLSSFTSTLNALQSSSGLSVHCVGGRGNLMGRMFRITVKLDGVEPKLVLYERKNESKGRSRWNSVSTTDDVKGVSGQMASAIDVLDEVATEECLTGSEIRPLSCSVDPCHPKNIDLLFAGKTELESPLTIKCNCWEDREQLLLAVGVANLSEEVREGVVEGREVEVTLFGGEGEGEEISFDANWDEDGSEDGSEEEEDDEEDDDLTLNVSTSRTHSVDTTTPDTDSGFKILQLETEMMILKKKLQRKEAQITELEASNSKAEREGYNSQMNVSTLQAELNTSHASISGLEEVKNGQAEEIKSLKATIEEFEAGTAKFEKQIQKLQKSLKSVENEKSVQSARVQNLENKTADLEDLRGKVKALTASSNKSGALEKQLNIATAKVESLQLTNDSLMEETKRMRKQTSEAKSSLSSTTSKLEALTKTHKSIASDLQGATKETQKLTAERNGLKQKAASLGKDLARLSRGGRSVKELEKMIQHYDQMRIENSVLKAEKKAADESMMEYKEAAELHVDARQRGLVDGEAERALQQRAELERIIASLTDDISTKEMQIDLMRDVNRKIAGELQEARVQEARARMGRGKAVGDGDGDGDDTVNTINTVNTVDDDEEED